MIQFPGRLTQFSLPTIHAAATAAGLHQLSLHPEDTALVVDRNPTKIDRYWASGHGLTPTYAERIAMGIEGRETRRERRARVGPEHRPPLLPLSPFVRARFSSESAPQRLVETCAAIKGIVRLCAWQETIVPREAGRPSIDALCDLVRGLVRAPSTMPAPPCRGTHIRIVAFGAAFKPEDKKRIRGAVADALWGNPAAGTVNNPRQLLVLGLDWCSLLAKQTLPVRAWWGWNTVDATHTAPAARTAVMTTLRLSTRPHLSTTTMDPLLAAFSAALVRARPGDLMLDPCAGSGSLLVAAASLGAWTLGADVDPGPLSHVPDVMAHYGFGDLYIEGVRANVFLVDDSAWSRRGLRFDGIITDIPYGRRERQVVPTGSAQVRTREPQEERLRGSGRPPSAYDGALEFLRAILELGTRIVRPGGRIVTWVPLEWGMRPLARIGEWSLSERIEKQESRWYSRWCCVWERTDSKRY